MENELSLEKTMTIKETADALGVSYALIIKRVNELFPGIVKNGKITRLNEAQVTAVKLRIVENSNLATFYDRKRLSEMPKTDIEKEMLILQAMQFQAEKVKSMQAELDVIRPKAELAEIALRDENIHYSIRDAGKHLGLSQSEIFSIMRAKELLTQSRMPTQKALNCNVLTLRTNTIGSKNYPQAVMTMQNIDNFRKRYL